MGFRYNRNEVALPPFQLIHVEAALSFFETHVDGSETLTLSSRTETRTLELDAKALEIFTVRIVEQASNTVWRYEPDRNKLVISLPPDLHQSHPVFHVEIRCRCVPSETILDGLYRDVTPPGAPQQYVSQCQQWGFQRILPIIDDCTAKCTFRTTLEGDSRYTHLISNGDVDRTTNPDGIPVPKPGDPSRQTVTYVNKVPMAPYLFIACAGTWDELSDTVTYPDGQRIALSYLVPKGKTDGARLPMDILKRAILWQHRRLGYTYPFERYRTITMEKSNYGGMENVGNTTIITEAALIDETTGDARLMYAHGVIVHEYEHNHCGSEVTMFSPFDMWLNEAYTVDIERQFMASVFDPTFVRLHELDALRAPGDGPLALEDIGKQGQIVREGFDDPDEVVDGVTYEKAPEVLNMLRQLLGHATYEAAAARYFARYKGGNATTDQFLACFEEVSGESLTAFSREWLYSIGYPKVTVRNRYDPATRTLHLHLEQTRTGTGGCFILPFAFAAVDAQGRDLVSQTFRFDTPEADLAIPDIYPPAFLSLNRNAGFYGTCDDRSATPDQLALQARRDPDRVNRVEAMRRLTDLERRRLLADPDALPSTLWLETWKAIAADNTLPDGLRGYLLQIGELPNDRELLAFVRENVTIRKRLQRAIADRLSEADFRRILDLPETGLPIPAAIERRTLKNALFQLLSVSEAPFAHRLLVSQLHEATAITARLNALTALWRSGHPDREALLLEAGETLRQTLGGKLGYLHVVGQNQGEEVFAAVEREAARSDFDWSHPGMVRALFVPLTLNNAQIWTPRGLAWLEETVVKLAAFNEYTTLRLLAPALGCDRFASDLRDTVRASLSRIRTRLETVTCPWVKSRLDAALQ